MKFFLYDLILRRRDPEERETLVMPCPLWQDSSNQKSPEIRVYLELSQGKKQSVKSKGAELLYNGGWLFISILVEPKK